ncbi:hypothetical protein ABMV07_04130 [Corynebacterium belfantii]|uniref:hypothetical protein n=1 Tax=Corynebacterium belfantii TaxID=2014537 RepID=UPI00096002AF|nr:hypothetical protein BUE64_10615 [Corynebacterium diphtheriae subsp. lausannense]QBZ30795.1 hypothetical protein E4653_14145 [Corynebacterium diphtheriae subsp. lausannense]
MNRNISQARESWFAKHPFDANKNAILTCDEEGIPAGFLTLPDMGEMEVIAMKYGYEFLASVRTDEDVDEWIINVNRTAKSPDLTGIMLAHAFRGIAPIIGQIIDNVPGLTKTMKTIAFQGWEMGFPE